MASRVDCVCIAAFAKVNTEAGEAPPLFPCDWLLTPIAAPTELPKFVDVKLRGLAPFTDCVHAH